MGAAGPCSVPCILNGLRGGGVLLAQLGLEAEQTQFHKTALPLLGLGGHEGTRHRQGPPPSMSCGVGHPPLPVLNVGTVVVFGAHILGLVCWQQLLLADFVFAGRWLPQLASSVELVLRHPCEVCGDFCVGSSRAF